MIGEFSINDQHLRPDQHHVASNARQHASLATQQSMVSAESSLFQRIVEGHESRVTVQADEHLGLGADEEPAPRRKTNILRDTSSRGLDKIRKSVIQQQSERYLMKKSRKPHSRGSIPNAGTSFQTTRNLEESPLEAGPAAEHIGTANKPRDSSGVMVVAKAAQKQGSPI